MLLLRPYFHVEDDTKLQWRPNPRGGTYQTLIDFATMPVAAGNVSGVLALANIPSLPASQITSGVFDSARIPTLSYVRLAPGATADNRIVPTGTTVVNIVTRSISGQTANHWQLESAVGTIFSFFDRFGRLTLNPQGQFSSTVATLGISTQAGDPAITVRHPASAQAAAHSFKIESSVGANQLTLQNNGRADVSGLRVMADPGAGVASQLTLTHTTITPGNTATPAGYIKAYVGTQAVGLAYFT